MKRSKIAPSALQSRSSIKTFSPYTSRRKSTGQFAHTDGQSDSRMLMEYGIVLTRHLSQMRRVLSLVPEHATNELTGLTRRLFVSLHDELLSLEETIAALDKQTVTEKFGRPSKGNAREGASASGNSTV